MADAPTSPPLPPSSRNTVLFTTALALLPLLLQLPTMLGLVLAVVAVVVAAASWRRSLPATLRLLLILAMLAAIYWQMGPRPGRDSGCAMLAAMLAIKSSELRSLRDARSLLGFALFAPFAAFLLDQGPTTMVLALAAVLSALLSLQQVANQEGQVGDAGLRVQWHAVWRLVAMGLPLALVAFWLFPRLSTPLWGIPDRAVGRPGLSDTMEPGEWLDLMADDTPALRVQFFGEPPGPRERYWRGPVMTDFDGRVWRHQPAALTMPVVTHGPTRWEYSIDHEPTDRRQLVALDLPLAAPAGSAMGADYSLLSDRPLNGLTRWRMQSAPAVQYDVDLGMRERSQALQLPPGRNPRTAALAAQWRQEAGNDDAAIVERAMAWITAEFGYTLATPAPGDDNVDEFLFDQKQGFCQHFSSAFVVLMRNAGIPARVVTGYAGGERNPLGDYWVVRRMDAHAWAEVWLQGRGWVRVDPTAAVAPERIFDTLEDRVGAGDADADQAAAEGWEQFAQWSDYLRRGWNNMVLSFDANRQQQLLRPLGIGRLEPGELIGLFALFAGATLGWMAWLLARGERERDPLLRAWHRLGRRYARLGLAREPHEPALDWARRVHSHHPDPALLALSQRFVHVRYAGGVKDDASLLRELRRHRPSPGASS